MTASVLVTGAAGNIGQAFLEEASDELRAGIIPTDIRIPKDPDARAGHAWHPLDVRDRNAVLHLIAEARPEVVVHLASIVSPGTGSTRDLEYAVDVQGTRNVLDACIENGVRRLVVTSSGAAYGYHADNPAWMSENQPIRGNVEFAYAHHKRLVEEMLAAARRDQPALEQVVLRVGTVLGTRIENQITALLRKPRLIAVAGSESPFVFIWDRDLARIIERAATDGPPGIYNVAGDGALSVRELASRLGKPVATIPAPFLKGALWVGRVLRLSRYGPEQVRFLQYRPVLDNRRLKQEFGYVPKLTSAAAFELWMKSAGLGPEASHAR